MRGPTSVEKAVNEIPYFTWVANEQDSLFGLTKQNVAA
jgi:hypothetical protein